MIEESRTKLTRWRGNRLWLFRVISASGALREENQPTEAMESSRGEPRTMLPGLSQFPSSAPAVPYGTRPRMSQHPKRRRHDPAYPREHFQLVGRLEPRHHHGQHDAAARPQR